MFFTSAHTLQEVQGSLAPLPQIPPPTNLVLFLRRPRAAWPLSHNMPPPTNVNEGHPSCMHMCTCTHLHAHMFAISSARKSQPSSELCSVQATQNPLVSSVLCKPCLAWPSSASTVVEAEAAQPNFHTTHLCQLLMNVQGAQC